MQYNKEILATMQDEMFHFNNMVTGEYSTFYFKSNGDVWSNESCRTYPTMSQMFKALHVPNMRPSKCSNEEGDPLPDVYDSYKEEYFDEELRLHYMGEEAPEEEEAEPVMTNVEIVSDILNSLFAGEIDMKEATKQAYNAVMERCVLPEEFKQKLSIFYNITR